MKCDFSLVALGINHLWKHDLSSSQGSLLQEGDEVREPGELLLRVLSARRRLGPARRLHEPGGRVDLPARLPAGQRHRLGLGEADVGRQLGGADGGVGAGHDVQVLSAKTF